MTRRLSHVVRQSTEIERYCIGCGTCTLVCPTDAIFPEYNFQNKFNHLKNKGGIPYMRGGRRNDPQMSTLDKLKFTRISMLTDPALDAGRHEFRVRTLLGRNLPAEQLPIKVIGDKLSMIEGSFVPPVREIFPIRIGSMSIGALSPHMWEGLAMGIAYLNEVEGHPGGHVLRRRRHAAFHPEVPLHQIFHPPDRLRLFRLGRDHPLRFPT